MHQSYLKTDYTSSERNPSNKTMTKLTFVEIYYIPVIVLGFNLNDLI